MIEAQTAILMERVANAQDFKEAERSHKAFMDALVMQVGSPALPQRSLDLCRSGKTKPTPDCCHGALKIASARTCCPRHSCTAAARYQSPSAISVSSSAASSF